MVLKNFIIAAGYKNKIIKDYFKKFKKMASHSFLKLITKNVI